MPNKIYLPMINLAPTMQCNLKCRLCGVLVPQYPFQPQMTIKELESTLKAVFEVADSVGKLQITGGEPLLHPDLPQMIEACFQYSQKFESLWLFTNCTIPLKPQLVQVLKKYKDKILIHISDYGVKKDIARHIKKLLDEINCKYRYAKYFGEEQYANGWVDQGDFILHNYSVEELVKKFSECTHVKRGGSWYVRGGQMHWCGRSIRGAEVNKIPQRDEDYLDIYFGTVEERRAKLHKLMHTDSILACDYCNGNYGTDEVGKRYPAGEQVV